MQNRSSFGTGVTGELFLEPRICTEVRVCASEIRLWSEDQW